MSAKIRLPIRIFNAVGRAVGRGKPGASFVAREESLLEAARRATGHQDFGDESFLEGLRVLLRAYDEEARLTPFGRFMVGQELAGILRARLRTEAGWEAKPEVLGLPVRRPVFILGLPRTGTTALHFLLAEDPGNQVLEYWLAAAPGPRPPPEDWKQDPRFKQAVQGLKLTYWLDPGLKAIHLMTPDGPDECRHLFLQSFLDHTFDSNATIPSYTRWFEAQDMRPAYARHRDVLRLIGSPEPKRRWVLKYPAHMRNLEVLLRVYPDACIVQTHRDPAKVLPSICSLVAGWRGLYEGRVDRRALGPWQLEMYVGMIETAVAVRDAHPEAQFFDLSSDEMTADPVAAIARLYAHFGFEFGPGAKRRMAEWHAANPQGRHGGHRYTAEEFGLSEATIRERFRGYTERFRVRKESPS